MLKKEPIPTTSLMILHKAYNFCTNYSINKNAPQIYKIYKSRFKMINLRGNLIPFLEFPKAVVVS